MPCNLYVLRHEQRDLTTPTFNVPLTPYGTNSAQGPLCELLDTKKFSVIYCSPFTRCLETIAPIAIRSNIPVVVDYNLYEWVSHPAFENEPMGTVDIEKYPFIKNVQNASMQIMYPETSDIRIERVQLFMKALQEKHENANENILICSHMDILHDIIKYNVPCWPRGYIGMGNLIHVNSLEYSLNFTLKAHATMVNVLVSIFKHMYVPLYAMNKIFLLKDRIASLSKQVINGDYTVRIPALWSTMDETKRTSETEN